MPRVPARSTNATTKRQRLSADARQAQLLDCAAELLVEGGTEALTMEGLAARARVNKALPYYHFKTRDAIVVALYQREHAKLASRVADAVSTAPDFPAKVRGLITAWLDSFDEPDVLGALAGVRTDDESLEHAQRDHNIESALFVADLIREQYAVPRDVALVAAGTVLASSTGFLPAWSSTRMSRARAIDLFVTMTLAAVEAAAERSAGSGASRPKSPRPPKR